MHFQLFDIERLEMHSWLETAFIGDADNAPVSDQPSESALYCDCVFCIMCFVVWNLFCVFATV